MTTFSGYTPEALDFLGRLPSRTPDWFKAHRKEYDALLVQPTKALVVDLGAALAKHLPDIIAQPKTNGSIGPINNDLRFSPNKPPYKDHLLLRFWEGATKKTAPTLYVRLTSSQVGFATGVLPADVSAWRAVIDGPLGEKLDRAINELAAENDADVVGEGLKRVPAPYPADHPRARLLRFKMLQVRWPEELPDAVHGPEFVEWCLVRLERCFELHRLMMRAFS